MAELVVAGGHNMLMFGPPGACKTLIAESLPSIRPRLSVDEALEVAKIYGVAGLLPDDEPLIRSRPFHANPCRLRHRSSR